MDTITNIMTRRSIRKFTEQPVEPEKIKIILEAAMNAPSAGDGRPWEFVVVTEKSSLHQIAEKVDGGNDMFRQAGAAILICAVPSKEKFPGFYPQDCSCAAQNIYLAAHELGLGSVWIAVWSVPPRIAGLREILDIPEHLEPFAIFPIGYPGESLPAEYRYDEALVHYEKVKKN